MSSTESTDPLPIAVIGAGAAGLLAAITAARAGSPVVLLEVTPDGGRKILISGGGRCNILPSVAEPHRYVTDSSPNLLKRMLRAWPLDEQRTFFERELEMPLVLEASSRKLFPASDRARDVRDRLVERVREAGARLWFGARVECIEPDRGAWVVSIRGAPSLRAGAVVLATGGLSVPATGSDGFGIGEARRLGHAVNPSYPALTPLTAEPNPHRALAGVSLAARIRGRGGGLAFDGRDGFLFTHRGWSGPVVLDASHLATRPTVGSPATLSVAWTDRQEDEVDRAIRDHGGAVLAWMTRDLPRRLAIVLFAELGLPAEIHAAQLRREDRRRLVEAMVRYSLPWTGDEGYKKAEVTGGGVALSEVDPRSMESRRHPGLFLCGELLDAFGPIGGHNFLWAWATGRTAGQGAARALSGHGGN